MVHPHRISGDEERSLKRDAAVRQEAAAVGGSGAGDLKRVGPILLFVAAEAGGQRSEDQVARAKRLEKHWISTACSSPPRRPCTRRSAGNYCTGPLAGNRSPP